MNYFFGAKFNSIKAELQIPLFQNRKLNNKKIKLFCAVPKNNNWIIEDFGQNTIEDKFYIIKDRDIDNEKIYFLANNDDVNNFDKNELIEFNNFTETFPAFRANLKIYLENGGFSSYQSEYPFSMIKKNGNILTPISTLLNSNVDKNYLVFKNIYFKPIKKKFLASFIDIKEKKIIKEVSFITNETNFLEIENELMKPNIYLNTHEFIGVPIYLSIKNKHISLEHTHPPHEYFFGQNKFKNVKILKERINEIFSK